MSRVWEFSEAIVLLGLLVWRRVIPSVLGKSSEDCLEFGVENAYILAATNVFKIGGTSRIASCVAKLLRWYVFASCKVPVGLEGGRGTGISGAQGFG